MSHKDTWAGEARRHFLAAVKPARGATMVGTCRPFVIEGETRGARPNINYGLWARMTGQCRFVHGSQCPTLVWDVDGVHLGTRRI